MTTLPLPFVSDRAIMACFAAEGKHQSVERGGKRYSWVAFRPAKE
jgi:hypothetical protein